LELNQTTFRHLVWLQAALIVAIVPLAIYEVENVSWSSFDAGVSRLSLQHFGRSTELTDFEALWAGIVSICSIVSLYGLYTFRRWGRLLFLLSFAFAGIFSMMGPVLWTSGPSSLMDILSSMSGGALLLMSYGNGLGADWFGSRTSALDKG
jgi:hypothetical protein